MDIDVDLVSKHFAHCNCQICSGEKLAIIITDKILVSPGPTILFATGDVEALTGYTAKELIGQSPRILQGPETDRELMHRIHEICEQGGCFEGCVVNYRKDKTPFMMGLAVSPIWVNGQIEYYFSIQSDVTGKETAALLPLIGTRIDTISKALNSASAKLSFSVDHIGSLLTQAICAYNHRPST